MINFCDHSPRLVFTFLNIFTYANNSIFTPLNFICLEIFYGFSNRQFYTIFISKATKYIVSSTSFFQCFYLKVKWENVYITSFVLPNYYDNKKDDNEYENSSNCFPNDLITLTAFSFWKEK